MIAVVFPNKSHLIDDRAVKIIVFSIYPIAILLSLFADYVLPCCRTNYSYKTYSYQFFVWNESTTNYKNMIMDLPMNIITTTIIFICYGAIFTKVIKTNRKNVIQMPSNTEFKKSKRKSELKCAAHFALISTFYIAVWVSYRIFPLIVSSSTPEWYSLTGFFMILNISSNAIIYFTMNKEVQKQLIISAYTLFGLPTTTLTNPSNNLINNNRNNNLQERWANQRPTQLQPVNKIVR
ncbi:unnamed protein product [Meloidogyne enterolobii]|uniref:Uncharacterized protein n=2 Tax=Meloidogyne enterolobii TaxID=390850 RepID=A0ACB0Y692_MELEN